MSDRFKQFLEYSTIFIVGCVLIILTYFTFPIVSGFFSFILRLLGPFIAGFIFAFLLVNVVDFLVRKGVKRIVAVAIVFILFASILTYAVISLIPIIINQVGEFANMAPDLFIKLDEMLANLYGRFEFIPDQYRFSLSDIGNYINANYSFSPSINLSGLFSVFNVVFLTPVATFYFLLEYPNIKSKIKRYLRRKRWFYFHRYLQELDKGMGSYLKGLLLVIHILGLVASLIFLIVGMDYPLIFGLFIGYTNVIPYIGPYLGGAPAVLYGFTTSPQLGIIALIVVVALQALETNILTPYIQGKTIHISPLYIVLAVSVFGKLFGIIGMIIAIPLLYFILLTARYLRVYSRCKKIKRLKQAQKIST
jgi:predicted PurR-regulated permease PerM